MPEKNNRDRTASIAVFCDFENIAIGVRESRYDEFDIGRVLERLLLKGSIVVKKAYCDWDRYKDFKKAMHEAAFELIEIPHVRQSGKNSADIRMVVDALDLCYTKPHVNAFVIMSGDSDFSSLVTKLRENDKTVVGVGVKNSTSDLFTGACDEFIFYDDLVREHEKRRKSRKRPPAKPRAAGAPKGEAVAEEKRQEAFDLVLDTIEMLWDERGDDDEVWGSMVKQAIKRRKPGFNESYYGFRSFSELLKTMEKEKMLVMEPDERSGGYIIRDVI
ncbi:MAG: NYN domain-containing protein [Candidatus Krumholzibacteria bacterium]|nr:NYN domain-containing protein [Candidatus Krumholzibacteria bacterium]MDH4335763.1 NYN domain-containing protein [Candidatus Krumholzibacteria bacterium]MDH5269289.1 NYN domain-containing protein [Candidatus Krumholzibacteria bacterium]